MPQILPPAPEREEPEHPGFQIVRWLRPFGSALVLLTFILFLVYAFTDHAPIKDYTPPHDGAYYAQHLDELADELNNTVLALVDPEASAEVTGDVVTVTIPSDSFIPTKGAVLWYFDSQLVQFEESK